MSKLPRSSHALVTGGGRGIGREIAATLARAGATVTVLGRHRATLDDAIAAGAAHFAVVADVSEVLANRLLRNDVEGTVEGTVDRDNAQLLVEYDQGLTNGVDDAVRTQMRSLRIGRMPGWAPLSLPSMTFCRHTGLLFSRSR